MTAKEAIKLLERYPQNLDLIVAWWTPDEEYYNEKVSRNWSAFVERVENDFDWSGTFEDMECLSEDLPKV